MKKLYIFLLLFIGFKIKFLLLWFLLIIMDDMITYYKPLKQLKRLYHAKLL